MYNPHVDVSFESPRELSEEEISSLIDELSKVADARGFALTLKFIQESFGR